MKGTTGAKRHAVKVRKDDLYETHPVAVHALLKEEQRRDDELPPAIWEPCCGPGAIVKALRESGRQVYATDLVDYSSPYQDMSGWDFLMEKQVPLGVQAIVTNPPFKIAAQIAEHALRLCPRVYMLLRLAFLEAGSEKSVDGRARLSVLDGGKLARVLVFRNRLPMMHRHGWDGPIVTNATAYAWFVWNEEHSGPTEIRRITWEREHGRAASTPQHRRGKKPPRGDPEKERRLF